MRQNVSRAVRFLRRRAGLRQADLGRRAGLSRESVSRLERGGIDGMTLAAIDRVATALGASADLMLRWHGEQLERLMDAGHAQLQESVTGGLRSRAFTTEVEVSFNSYGDRGRYDALAFEPGTGTLLVVEVKTRIVDVQDTLGRLDVKVRLAPEAARRLGWPRPRRVVPCLVVQDSRSARRIVAAHAQLFARFTHRGRAARQWLSAPTGEPISGILLFESAQDSQQTTARSPSSRR